MDYRDHLPKTFTDRAYCHTAMITHKGTVVAFAMDGQRVSSTPCSTSTKLPPAATARPPASANSTLSTGRNRWPAPFPKEISQVGDGIADPTKMPVVKKDSGGGGKPTPASCAWKRSTRSTPPRPV